MSGPNNPGPNYIHGQGVAVDGSLVGSNFMISDNSSTTRWWPVVAASDSNYLVVWGQNTSSDIYGNIDTPLLGIEDDYTVDNTSLPFYTSTILSDRLNMPEGIDYFIYDAMGRRVENSQLKPGVYFIKIDGKITQKVVKIK